MAWRLVAVGAFVVLVGGCGLSPSSGQQSITDERADELAGELTSCFEDEDKPVKISVWMEPDTDEAKIGPTFSFLNSLNGNTEFIYIDRDETYDRFVERYKDDDVTLSLFDDPAKLPTSFEAVADDRIQALSLADEIEEVLSIDEVVLHVPASACQAEVDAIVTACDGPAAAVERPVSVWLDGGIDPAGIEAVRSNLEQNPLVISSTYLDAEELNRRAGFGDDEIAPEVLEQNPTLFEVTTLAEVDALRALIVELELLAGVDTAVPLSGTGSGIIGTCSLHNLDQLQKDRGIER